MRTPFIVRWPGRVPAGRVNDKSVVTGVDFLPTMCSLAGIELPAGYETDGQDVGDILRGACGQRDRAIRTT